MAPLKPSLVEWKPEVNAAISAVVSGLETFLSGMETRDAVDYLGESPSLKPSLVEWKQFRCLA